MINEKSIKKALPLK